MLRPSARFIDAVFYEIMAAMPAGKKTLWIAAGALLAFAAILSAQSARTYGPGRIWWDAGQDDVLPWDEDYENPRGTDPDSERCGRGPYG